MLGLEPSLHPKNSKTSLRYVAYRTTPYSVYSPETYEGHWKQLTVRTTRTKQAMAIVFFHPQVRGMFCLLCVIYLFVVDRAFLLFSAC